MEGMDKFCVRCAAAGRKAGCCRALDVLVARELLLAERRGRRGCYHDVELRCIDSLGLGALNLGA